MLKSKSYIASLEAEWTERTIRGPQPLEVESMCRGLCFHIPPLSLGTEAGSHQGKQADNQVGPELKRKRGDDGGRSYWIHQVVNNSTKALASSRGSVYLFV